MPKKKSKRKLKARTKPIPQERWRSIATRKVIATVVKNNMVLLEQFHDLSEQDVMHDILVKLQRIEPKYLPSKSRWESYVYRTARCTILDMCKVRTRQAKRDAKFMGVTEDQHIIPEEPEDDSPNVRGELFEGEIICSTIDDGYTLFQWLRNMFVGAVRASGGDRDSARLVSCGMLMDKVGVGPAECRSLLADRSDLRLALDLCEQHEVPSLGWFEASRLTIRMAQEKMKQEE